MKPASGSQAPVPRHDKSKIPLPLPLNPKHKNHYHKNHYRKTHLRTPIPYSKPIEHSTKVQHSSTKQKTPSPKPPNSLKTTIQPANHANQKNKKEKLTSQSNIKEHDRIPTLACTCRSRVRCHSFYYLTFVTISCEKLATVGGSLDW